MPELYCLSGPCGAGKTTLSALLAAHLSHLQGGRQVCLLHGDDFHHALIGDERSPAAMRWLEVLRFNWDCLISAAGHALARGLDVVLDYVIEDELPRIQALAAAHGAEVYLVALTASEEAIRARLRQRGDAQLTDRALFLKQKLEALPENQGHLLDATNLSPQELLRRLEPRQFRLPAPLVTNPD